VGEEDIVFQVARSSKATFLQNILREEIMKKISLALLLSAFIAAPAFAADTGGYAGLKLGSADKSVNGVSERNGAFGIFGGYSFNPYVAVELGYTDLGSMISGVVKFTSWDVSAVGTFPINQQFSIYGKLGFADTKEEGLGLSGTRSTATYGLGGQFNVNPNVGIRLGWEHYGFGDGSIWAEGDASLVSVSALYKF
jgi:OOP family OmpA-OmpF porin